MKVITPSLCLLLGAAVSAVAQNRAPQQRPEAPARLLTPAQFVAVASASGLAEVNMGNMAIKHGTSLEIRQYGQRLVDDHTRANKELNRLATAENLTPAATMDAAHRTLARRMEQLRGPSFDQAFLKHMVMDHQEAIAIFEQQARKGQDPQLKGLAAKMLPVLRDHLRLARRLQKQLGGQRGTQTGRPQD